MNNLGRAFVGVVEKDEVHAKVTKLAHQNIRLEWLLFVFLPSITFNIARYCQCPPASARHSAFSSLRPHLTHFLHLCSETLSASALLTSPSPPQFCTPFPNFAAPSQTSPHPMSGPLRSLSFHTNGAILKRSAARACA